MGRVVKGRCKERRAGGGDGPRGGLAVVNSQPLGVHTAMGCDWADQSETPEVPDSPEGDQGQMGR